MSQNSDVIFQKLLHENNKIEELLSPSEHVNSNILVNVDCLETQPFSSIEPFWQTSSITLIGAFVGALAAYFFTHLHSLTVRKKEIKARIANNLNKQIQSLEESSILYWLSSYEKDKKIDQTAEEINIKNKLTLIRNLSVTMREKITSKDHNQLHDDLKSFNDSIFDLITGDGFESKGRKSSKNKASKISKECSTIRSKIYELELSII